MRNKKGFTLIELLATIVVLGIIMIVAIPNIVGILSNNRNSVYIEDAKKLVSTAEYRFRANTGDIVKPDDGECIIISLEYLDNSEFENAPNNGQYLKDNSGVVIFRDGNQYRYYVRLVEQLPKNAGYRGISFRESSALYGDNTSNLVSEFDRNDIYGHITDQHFEYDHLNFCEVIQGY